MSDLSTKAFQALTEIFFDDDGNPEEFFLREKRNTQDNPFDEYVHNKLNEKLRGIHCQNSSPLVNPDLVLARDDFDPKTDDESDLDNLISVEVKKLERTDAGNIARSSGLDYNSTPPCGTVRIYDSDENPLNVRSFYFFACLEEADDENHYKVTAFVLTDGNVLNKDFDLYKSLVIDSREKKINLGTYQDGMNRQRPMLVFPNPLGVDSFDHNATLIHESDSLADLGHLNLNYTLTRTKEKGEDAYYCYQGHSEEQKENIVDFPSPSSRSKSTSSRGKFRLDFDN